MSTRAWIGLGIAAGIILSLYFQWDTNDKVSYIYDRIQSADITKE